MKKGDAVPQSYSRYYARDFEQRWRKRLDMTPGWPTSIDGELHVKVTHRFSAPKPYGWELRPAAGLPVEESRAPIQIMGRSQPGRKARFKTISDRGSAVAQVKLAGLYEGRGR